MKDAIVVCGPTAVGKTALAIELAKEFDGEVLSCDSMQLYRFMDIGSAKPTEEELRAVPHHLIGEIDPRESFSVARYRKLAMEHLDDILVRGKTPVICGGTGLYLESLLYDMDFAASPTENNEGREELYEIAEREGADKLFELLKQEDPKAADRIHPNNIKRVVRAIESARAGKKIDDFGKERIPNPEINPIMIGLTMDREELYNRINKRVDLIMEAGLLAEVRGLMEMGLDENDFSMKGIGYKEIISYLKNEISLEESVDLIKKNTRHYAKRQITWFKRYDDIKWFNMSDYTCFDALKEDVIRWLKREQ